MWHRPNFAQYSIWRSRLSSWPSECRQWISAAVSALSGWQHERNERRGGVDIQIDCSDNATGFREIERARQSQAIAIAVKPNIPNASSRPPTVVRRRKPTVTAFPLRVQHAHRSGTVRLSASLRHLNQTWDFQRHRTSEFSERRYRRLTPATRRPTTCTTRAWTPWTVRPWSPWEY